MWVEVSRSRGLHHFNLLNLEVAPNLLRCKHQGKSTEEQQLALSAVVRLPYAAFFTNRNVVQVEKAEFGSYSRTYRNQSSFGAAVTGVCLRSYIYAVDQFRKGFLMSNDTCTY